MKVRVIGLAGDLPAEVHSAMGRLIITRVLFVSMMFSYPFMYEFLNAQGITRNDFMLLQGIMMWGLALAEIPSGLIADRFGRRSAMALGGFLLLLGALMLWHGKNMIWFGLAEFFLGFGYSLRTGTDFAYINDLLARLQLRHRFKELVNVYVAYDLIVGASFPAIGGLLFVRYGIDAPFAASCVGLMLSMASIALLPKTQLEVAERASTRKILASAWQVLRDSRALRWVLVFDIFFMMYVELAEKHQRPLFKEMGIAPDVQAYFAAVATLIPGALQLWFNRTLSNVALVPTATFFVITAIFVMALNGVCGQVSAMLAMLVISFIHWVMLPINQGEINARNSHVARATILSGGSMCVRFLVGLMLIVLSRAGITWPTQHLLVAIGFVGGVILLAILAGRLRGLLADQ